MALHYEDVLTVDNVKTALRLGSETDHDTLISGYIRTAVYWVDQMTEYGLVDTNLTTRVAVDDIAAPITLQHHTPHVLDFAAVGNEDGPYASAVTLTRDAAPYGSSIRPPAGGWVITAPGSWVDIKYLRGTTAQEVPAALKSAVEVLVRDLYDGRENIGSSWTARLLLAPYAPQFRQPNTVAVPVRF